MRTSAISIYTYTNNDGFPLFSLLFIPNRSDCRVFRLIALYWHLDRVGEGGGGRRGRDPRGCNEEWVFTVCLIAVPGNDLEPPVKCRHVGNLAEIRAFVS